MSAPRLSLSANSRGDLLEQLSAIDIAVPLVTEESRTKDHRERYMAARLMATLARDSELTYPAQLHHREKPDFALRQQEKTIGIECVEAVSNEWAHINVLRETDYPEALIMLPMLKPGTDTFTRQERVQIAQGLRSGPPWVGDMAERQWAEAISYFIEGKLQKLRSGNYSEFSECWLLVQDEWRVPLYRPEHKRKAAELCVQRLQDVAEGQSFERIYVCSGESLIRLSPFPSTTTPIHNLWK